MNPIHILYLDHSNDFSGGQVSLLALLEALDRKKFTPIAGIDQQAHKMKKELNRLGIPVVEFDFQKISVFAPRQFFSFVVWLKKLVKEKRIDIIHTNTYMSGLMLAVVKELIGKPFIFRARLAIDFHGHGFVDQIIYRRADLILANSFYVQHSFESKYGESRSIRTIYNPMDTKPIEFQSVQRHGFVFAIFGRIESIKRHHEVVDAVEILAKKGAKFTVWIFGAPSKADNGNYHEEVLSSISVKKLDSYFIWKGFVENPMRFARAIDACISCTVGEALSRSIFECQLHEVPVIASRSGGNTEIIDNGRTGFLFNPRDPADLATQMEAVMSMAPTQIDSIVRNAKSQNQDLFSIKNTVKEEEICYLDLYNRHRKE